MSVPLGLSDVARSGIEATCPATAAPAGELAWTIAIFDCFLKKHSKNELLDLKN